MDAAVNSTESGAGWSKLAIVSLTLGLLGLVFWITAVPAIICGHIAKSRIARSPIVLRGRRLATIGLITGYFSILAVLAVMILLIVDLALIGKGLAGFGKGIQDAAAALRP